MYNFDLNPELNGQRLVGVRLLEMKLLTYILRLYFNVTYVNLSNKLCINKASAQRFYSDVLSTPVYRNEAEGRYRRCSALLNKQAKQSA